MPITTKVVSSNPAYCEVYSIQLYVIKFLNDLRQAGSFLRFPPPIKTDRHDITEQLLKMAFNIITLDPSEWDNIFPTNISNLYKGTLIVWPRNSCCKGASKCFCFHAWQCVLFVPGVTDPFWIGLRNNIWLSGETFTNVYNIPNDAISLDELHGVCVRYITESSHGRLADWHCNQDNKKYIYEL